MMATTCVRTASWPSARSTHLTSRTRPRSALMASTCIRTASWPSAYSTHLTSRTRLSSALIVTTCAKPASRPSAQFYLPDIADKTKISPDGNYMYMNGSVLTTLRWTSWCTNASTATTCTYGSVPTKLHWALWWYRQRTRVNAKDNSDVEIIYSSSHQSLR